MSFNRTNLIPPDNKLVLTNKLIINTNTSNVVAIAHAEGTQVFRKGDVLYLKIVKDLVIFELLEFIEVMMIAWQTLVFIPRK